MNFIFYHYEIWVHRGGLGRGSGGGGVAPLLIRLSAPLMHPWGRLALSATPDIPPPPSRLPCLASSRPRGPGTNGVGGGGGWLGDAEAEDVLGFSGITSSGAHHELLFATACRRFVFIRSKAPEFTSWATGVLLTPRRGRSRSARTAPALWGGGGAVPDPTPKPAPHSKPPHAKGQRLVPPSPSSGLLRRATVKFQSLGKHRQRLF